MMIMQNFVKNVGKNFESEKAVGKRKKLVGVTNITKKYHDSFEQAFNDYFAGNKDTEVIVHSNKEVDQIIPVKYFFRNFDDMFGIEKVILADIFKYDYEKYDTLLMLMNGIGITQNLTGLAKFLSHSKNLLNPDRICQ